MNEGFDVDSFDTRLTRSNARVKEIKAMTTSAWSQEIIRVSKPNRFACSSPACGPLPVTSVPSVITSAVSGTRNLAIVIVVGLRVELCLRSLTRPSMRWRSESAPAINGMLKRKWPATGIGLSLVSTVIPPRTPCAKMPRNCPSAKRRISFLSILPLLHLSAPARAAIDAMTSAKVSNRLENSIQTCRVPCA